jgi:hypothetical protein
MSSPAAAITADPDAADALAWAELRHDMLLRLASLGMSLAEETAQRAINAPYHPETHHEPCRAFASISRAVRLTLVLEARVAIDVLALRKGETLKAPPVRAPRPPGEPRGAEDRDFEPDGRERTRESLVDREDYEDVLLSGSFEACVDAIRADLGLAPGEEADETSALRSGASRTAVVPTASSAPPMPAMAMTRGLPERGGGP